jgi:hypothetical protein
MQSHVADFFTALAFHLFFRNGFPAPPPQPCLFSILALQRSPQFLTIAVLLIKVHDSYPSPLLDFQLYESKKPGESDSVLHPQLLEQARAVVLPKESLGAQTPVPPKKKKEPLAA